MLAVVGLSLHLAALTPPAIARREACLGAASIVAFRGATAAAAVDRSLVDADGNFVVDPAKAAAGLEDPLAEPVGAYSSISAALAAATSGATVIVRPGVYQERIKISRSVVLKAEPGAILSWESDKPYEAALTVDLSEAGTAADVLVSGLAIKHFSPSIAQNYAVYVPPPSRAADAQSRIELRYCDVSSRSGSGVGVEGGMVSVVSCRVHDCKNHGLSYLGPSARGTVRGCSIETCKLNGVLVRDGAAPTLEANRFNANLRYGAELIDARCTFRADNEAKGNGKGAVGGECDDE